MWDPGLPIHAQLRTSYINALLEALRDELAAEGVPAPLAQSFTLAALWHDLARLAGEEPPSAVAALLDQPLDLAAVAAD